MDNILLYLLKVSAGTTLFYLCYLLFFRKDTFYLRNRILLILTLVLPLVVPAIKIAVVTNNAVPEVQITPIENIIYSQEGNVSNLPGVVNSPDYMRLFLWIYFSVTALLLLRITISLITTYRIIKKGTVKTNQFPGVVLSENDLPPFSFFPYAVIPAEDYNSGNCAEILDHEFAHIRQGHTFDLLLSELFIAFQWFNPFVWYIKRSVVLNHEYLADVASLRNNKCIKEYQYRLLNLQTELKNISLAHSFNSLIKNRIIMINKKPTRKFAALKNILILPVAAFVTYAFATPDYHNSVAGSKDNSMSIYQPAVILQKEIKGVVIKEDGKPLEGVEILSTSTLGNSQTTVSGSDGRFSIANAVPDAILVFNYRGYKQILIKSDLIREMKVKMEKDPDFKATAGTNPKAFSVQRSEPLVSVDGVISDKRYNTAKKDLGYNMGIAKMIIGKEATDKYGDKAVNGVWEITTRKKAIAMGLKPPFPRLVPDDYPTFQNKSFDSFNEWVGNQIKYPAEAQTKKLEGWVALNFNVELNGTISNIVSAIPADQILMDEVIRVVMSSPKWEAPKNKNVDEPFPSSIILKFKSPGQILTEPPFVVVEEMPMYNPGGDVELLNFIKKNTRYPEAAKARKIQGRVIVRFVVSTEGKAEGISVLKGIDPLLDAEAIRVTSMLSGFKPGKQGGKPVNVWYMAPITFKLTSPEPLFTQNSETEILKFLGQNTGYPQEAKMTSDTGSVYITVKMDKGGIIRECKAFTEREGINMPFLNQVVIVAYKPSEGQNTPGMQNAVGKEHLSLKTECERVANKIGSIDIPEWKEKNMEFALAIRFILK
jgi:TonB family protein